MTHKFCDKIINVFADRSLQAASWSLPEIRLDDKTLAWSSNFMDSRQRAEVHTKSFAVASLPWEAILLQISSTRFRAYISKV